MTLPLIAQSDPSGKWRQWTLRYSVALAATGVALGIWFLWPVMRQDPFAIFITAVIVSARFAGFGPALLCTAASSLAIDYFIFEPRFSLALYANDYGRLGIFIAVSILTASLARQRSRAQTRAEQTQRQLAAMVESSDDAIRSEEHTSELQSLTGISYAVFCLKKKNTSLNSSH